MAQIPSSFLRDWKPAGIPDPAALVTTCTPRTITTGSGLDIFAGTLVPALLSARREILLATCFWDNPSPTLTALSDALARLAARRTPESPELLVRIGFSSRSPWQRLRHQRSPDGEVYPPETWAKVLGLPSQERLRAGNVNLAVKTLFWGPLSVVHPKFLIVDRRRAWMPSCNVSRVVWFEGCVGFEGDGGVGALVDFWRDVWGRGQTEWELGPEGWEAGDMDQDDDGDVWQGQGGAEMDHHAVDAQSSGISLPSRHVVLAPLLPFTPTIVLPSPHSVNPHFRPTPLLGAVPPRPTPLNAALLALFATATSRIDIITPNLTCGAVVNALLDALARGVDVKIRTSRGMMVLEQLVTAGSLTSWWVRGMIAAHRRMGGREGRGQKRGRRTWWEWVLGIKGRPGTARAMDRTEGEEEEPSILEAQLVKPGALEIMYYSQDPGRRGQSNEPTVSHFKMTRVDEQFVVLGSGNMDRASWYTSQELGILFHAPELDTAAWEEPLATRTEVVYKSD